MLRKETKHFISQEGFTLAEVLVASAVSGLVLLAAFVLSNMINKGLKKAEVNIMSTTSDIFVEEVISSDFRSARHSLNNINIKDDTGKSFYRYIAKGLCPEECKRTLTLDLPTKEGEFSRSFFVIIEERVRSHQQLFSPIDAYDTSTSGLNFRSINKGGQMDPKNRAFSPWRNKSLVLLYSPQLIKKNPSDLGSTISFMGWVEDQTDTNAPLVAERIIDTVLNVEYYNPTNPRDGLPIDSEKTFFEKSPYTQGLANHIYITGVKIIRYRLEAWKDKNNIVGRLWRGVQQSDKTFKERSIGHGIENIIFKRDSIRSPAIAVETNYFKKN